MPRKTRASEPAAPPPLEPCAKCGLRLGPADTPTGRALHDCQEVQRLRRLADENRKESTLEVELEAFLRRALEEDRMTPPDAAKVLAVLRKGRVENGGGPSEQLLAFLRD